LKIENLFSFSPGTIADREHFCQSGFFCQLLILSLKTSVFPAHFTGGDRMRTGSFNYLVVGELFLPLRSPPARGTTSFYIADNQ